MDDRFSLRVLTSNAPQRYFRASSQLPAEPVSTRIGVAHSDMTYRLGGEFEDLDCSKKASVCRARHAAARAHPSRQRQRSVHVREQDSLL
ncbi:hypothetical protein [Burkholderia pyrrocinia]|uniref:hypothetical protein n=1 Tax=Burkholderia pyrrocinia TaxID=60550 RepID=UPI001BCD13B1|nr:hypothetical protein [Burkholderia pyrrocinia]QVN20178.1 hypothetical protein JYG32_26640 [Burkholderia pyrrocinia]